MIPKYCPECGAIRQVVGIGIVCTGATICLCLECGIKFEMQEHSED